jgi:hypothetical protein
VILWWTKDIFDNDVVISDYVWSKVVKEIDDNHLDFASQVISDDISNVLSNNGVIA